MVEDGCGWRLGCDAERGTALAGNIQHMLLISIDGFHAVDLQNCVSGLPSVNGGSPYCPTLTALVASGVNYTNASTAKPSDSFPGLMALVTGGSPRTVGVFDDVTYDRVLAPPRNTTGNGLLGGPCTPNVANGARTEYEKCIDIDQTKLNGGAPSGDGGVNSIDPATRRWPELARFSPAMRSARCTTRQAYRRMIRAPLTSSSRRVESELQTCGGDCAGGQHAGRADDPEGAVA